MRLVSMRGICIVMLAVVSPISVHAQDSLTAQTPYYAQILADWQTQDGTATKGYRTVIQTIINGLPASVKGVYQSRLDGLAGAADTDARMSSLYMRVCSARRAARFAPYTAQLAKIALAKHAPLGGFFYAELLCDRGQGISQLTMNGIFCQDASLVGGDARDPDVSFDGTRLLYTTGGRIWEMNIATKVKRQITTSGFGCDYDPIYLPNGNIMFSSERMVQWVDCVDQPMANLFVCDKDGKYIRRIGYDQAPTQYPKVLPSGEIIYTRWDYNDRGHWYAHGLFIMKPDGTAQREYYGNNSWWPTVKNHSRPIPGSNKIMTLVGGYHCNQCGKVAIIDNTKGMQDGEGMQLVAPIRPNVVKIMDEWQCTEPPWFMHPNPLDENAFVAGYMNDGDPMNSPNFGFYFFTVDGSRELLYKGGNAGQSVFVAPRTTPPNLASTVDYKLATATYQIMNVYYGQSLKGVTPGTIKSIRVTALDYRTGPAIGEGQHMGPASINSNNTPTFIIPVAVNNGTWDTKRVLGDAEVASDGSANFTVPARVPVYFQAIDANGRAVQTMRSWSTLQPGETFSCFGCHESKLEATPTLPSLPIALQSPPKPLKEFYGPARQFSYTKEIQPILDAKCVSCHDGTAKGGGYNLKSTAVSGEDAGKTWVRSYVTLTSLGTNWINWLNAEDVPTLLDPNHAGSVKSPIVDELRSGHKTRVQLTKEEMDKICCWIDLLVPFSGEYWEGMNAGDAAATKAEIAKRKAWETVEAQNIAEYVAAGGGPTNAMTTSGSHMGASDLTLAVGGRHPVRLPVDAGSSTGDHLQIGFYTVQGALVRMIRCEMGRAEDMARLRDTRLRPGNYIVRISSRHLSTSAKMVVLR